MTPLGRVLFVGTGGGNDVFSTTLAILALRDLGWLWESCSIAGVLSPFHRHAGVVPQGPAPWSPVIITERARRFVPRTPEKEIGFMDAAVAKMVDMELALRVDRVIGLDLRHGTEGLTQAFAGLADRFDTVILVDVGGDIFFRGPDKDPRVLSPMFDAMVLRALCDSPLPGILFEAGPGTDGELSPEAMRAILSEPNVASHQLEPSTMSVWRELFKRYVEPVRPGRTVPMTIRAYGKGTGTFTMPYRARAHAGSRRWYATFDHEIDAGLCTALYLTDPRTVVNPFAVACTDPLDWFRKTQIAIGRTNCEANLEYLVTPGGPIQILTPSPLFAADDREQILLSALEDLRDGACDGALLLPDDAPFVERNLPTGIALDADRDNDFIYASRS